MPLPWTDILQIVAVGVLIYIVARTRPSPMTNSATIQTLIAQLQTITAERDHWRELAQRTEMRCQELERGAQVDRKTIARLHDDNERRGQTLR